MPYGTLIRTHPNRFAASALRDAERAFDLANRLGQRPGWALRASSGFAPRIHAVENEAEYVVTAELPGVEPANLSVLVEEGVLTVSGERRSAKWSEDLSDEEKAKHASRFERRIRFNGEIDEPAVKAAYRNGLLTVTVPKPKAPEPEVRTIPVEVG